MVHFRRPILRFVLAVVSRPRLTLAITLALTAVCVALAVARLRISTEQNKLFSRNVRFFRDYVAFSEEFPENEAIYVIVEPKDKRAHPPVERWTGAAEAIVEGLKRIPQHVEAVAARVAPEELGNQQLLFEDPRDLPGDIEDIGRFVPIVRRFGEEPGPVDRTLRGPTRLDQFLSGPELLVPNKDLAPLVRSLAESWARTIRLPRPVLPDLNALGATDPKRLGYFYVPDEEDRSRRLLLVRVRPRENFTSLTAISETVEAIRAAVAQAAKDYGEFDVGVTGRPALEADEMRTTDIDSTRAEIVALSAVFVGLVLLLRSFWLALAAELALGVGIAWTFGWATVTLGELNLLSIVFMLALIGIGMDYLVQILSRYRHQRLVRADPKRIWVAVFRQVGAPINTATLGAAGAFLVSLFTDFQGAADLGLIAGGGLILCLIAGHTFLPALLSLGTGKQTKMEDGRWRMEKESGNGVRRSAPSAILYSPSFLFKRWLGPIVWLVLLVLAAPFALRTRFNPSLLELQAPNLRSVQLVRKLQTWSAEVLSKDLGALRQAREALRGAGAVDHTESILDAWDNYETLIRRSNDLPKIEWAKPQTLTPADVERLARKAEGIAAAWEKAPGVGDAVAALREFAGAARGAAPEAVAARLSGWQGGFVEQLQALLASLSPPPPDVSKVPAGLRDHLVGRSGVYALHIYPKGDLWDQAALERFVGEIESRLQPLPQNVTLTGIAHNIAHSTASIRSSFFRATFYALGLIVLLVLIDLRRVGQTLAAVSVLALGLPMLVGLMGLLGVDWNFANFFGLPILIGAGHEYGVFLIHRYREALAHPRRGWIGWDVADKALLLCAFVTSSSFGFFFLLAHHRGLKSLGLVMALGSACIYLASVLAVRPVLKWKLAKRNSAARSEEREEDEPRRRSHSK